MIAFEFESNLNKVKVGYDPFGYIRHEYMIGLEFDNGAKIETCPIEYSKISGNESGMICLHELEGACHVIITFMGKQSPKPEKRKEEVHHGIIELQPTQRSANLVKGAGRHQVKGRMY